MKRALACVAGVLAWVGASQVTASPPKAPRHVEHVGFALTDVGWDDPHDKHATTSYVEEVAAFSTLVDQLVVYPEQDLTKQLDALKPHRLRALLHLSELVFVQDPAGEKAPSGNPPYRLRDDFAERWDRFVERNKLVERQDELAALYVGEEPTWNGIGFAELERACDHLKASLPKVPILVVEAAPALKALKLPKSVDWVGFDHYFLKQGAKAPEFLEELALLKAKRSGEHQRVVLVPDAHFIPEVHGHFKVTREDLLPIAESYLELARKDTDVVAVLAYFWPGGFDHPEALGARNMPKLAKVYARFGRAVKKRRR